MRCYSYGCSKRGPCDGADLVEQQIQRAHRYYNTLIQIERERRAAMIAAGEDKTAVAAATARSRERIREERARCGTYWGTYNLLVEHAARAAAWQTRWPEPPSFRKWTGEGSIGVQIKGGMSVAELLAGDDTSVRLVGDGKIRTLRIRVGSNGRAPVWAAITMVYHRPLPEDARIKNVRLVRRRVGTHYRYSAQFVLDYEARLPTAEPGTALAA